MLVDVALMRHPGGLPLPTEKVTAAAPIRGQLRFKGGTAELHDPLDDDPIAPGLLLELQGAKVTLIVQASMMIVGEADTGPQAWWCRLV